MAITRRSEHRFESSRSFDWFTNHHRNIENQFCSGAIFAIHTVPRLPKATLKDVLVFQVPAVKSVRRFSVRQNAVTF